jgi:HlyD family secretion protein
MNGGDGEVSQQLVEVVRGDLTVTVSGSGTIEVSNERKLAFGSSGRIDEIYVDEGDMVNKGDVLAKLDTSALELALVQARVARDEAEYNLNQLKNVIHASYDRVKIAEAQLEAAERAVAEVQKQLGEATITAPFDGVIASVDVDEGDTVSMATTIVHLIDLTSMELIAEVDEIDIAEVKPGQRAIIEVDALPALQLEGKVISISLLPEVEAGVVLYEAKIGFDASPDSELKVGMSADTDIIINERSNVLLVPDRAITKDNQGNPMVKVMVNEEIEEEKPVVIGISDGYQTEIVDGLNEGEVVVVERRARS